MYPLPNKVAIQQDKVYTKDYLLVPEYNSFGKPKWPKIVPYSEREFIFKNAIEKNNNSVVFHQGPLYGNPTDFQVTKLEYLTVQPYDFIPNESAPPIDPFDKKIEFYILDHSL